MPQSECDGVGISLISLTVPNNADFVDVIAVFWSLVPYALLAAWFFTFFFTQRISFFILLVFGLISSGVNEFIIKNIHKEDRPATSCLDSGAFPSGHASLAALYLVWLTLETLTHKGWTWRKKGIILAGLWAILVPCGPFRHVVGDHTWSQIYVGLIAGAIWGLIDYLLTRLLIVVFLEDIMSWRICKWFHIRNDLRPNYEGSRHKGTKVPDQVPPPVTTNLNTESNVAPQNDPNQPPLKNSKINMMLFWILHSAFILINIAIGVIGIVLGPVVHHRNPDCNKASPAVISAVGSWTVIGALLQIVVLFLAHRKLKEKKWWPEGVQAFLMISGFFHFEAFFWNIASIQTSTHDDNCPPTGLNIGLAYGVLWFAAQFVLLLIAAIAAWKLDLKRLYGFKKSLTFKNPNTHTAKEFKAAECHKNKMLRSRSKSREVEKKEQQIENPSNQPAATAQPSGFSAV